MTDMTKIKQMVGGDQGLAIVSIGRADGSVHTSLVNAGVSQHPVTGDEVIGFVVRGSSHKLNLLAKNPQASVTWRNSWDWAAASGGTQICGPDHALEGVAADAIPELLRQVFRDAGGTHDDWEEYDRVMAAEKRTAVFVQPAKLLSNG